MPRCSSPRPDTVNVWGSSVSSTRSATLRSSSRYKRSRTWRPVTNLPSRPANGESFTRTSTEMVGSSTAMPATRSGGSPAPPLFPISPPTRPPHHPTGCTPAPPPFAPPAPREPPPPPNPPRRRLLQLGALQTLEAEQLHHARLVERPVEHGPRLADRQQRHRLAYLDRPPLDPPDPDAAEIGGEIERRDQHLERPGRTRGGGRRAPHNCRRNRHGPAYPRC